MSKALAGIALDDLAFVGLLEYLEEDVADLAAMLGWGPYIIPVRNQNKAYKAKFASPTAEELAEIASFNQADVELYQHAQELRRRRRSSAGGRN